MDLDPRWEWFDVTVLGDHELRFVKGRCNHLETHMIVSCVTGDELAQLCATCGAQFPPACE